MIVFLKQQLFTNAEFHLKQGVFMNKKCWLIIMVLLFVILGGAYKFLIQGSTTESQDGRLAIHLTAGERNLVLSEMRSFLASVQQITQGLAENDMARVAEYAKKVGKNAQGEVPGTLMGKLPMEFKKLGFNTHMKFDQLALDASSMGDNGQILEQLSTLMQNCVACHASYRLEAVEK
jgi:mono/diheme cytochrome c family protein